VTVAVAPPSFVANAPTEPFEANKRTPFGANLTRLYVPRAVDPIDGDLSASIKTFLVSNNQQITLSGLSAYIFPLGSTQIKNAVTNSAGLTTEELVTIVVVDTTKPVLTVKPLLVVVNPWPAPERRIRYPGNQVSGTRAGDGGRGDRGGRFCSSPNVGLCWAEAWLLAKHHQHKLNPRLPHLNAPISRRAVHGHRPGARQHHLQPALWQHLHDRSEHHGGSLDWRRAGSEPAQLGPLLGESPGQSSHCSCQAPADRCPAVPRCLPRTQVNCTATDTSNNQATGSFVVSVRDPVGPRK
jgi:hypothetical protein